MNSHPAPLPALSPASRGARRALACMRASSSIAASAGILLSACRSSNFKAAKQDGVSIPPAWTNVSYNGKTGKDGIVARGTDAKGRKQVIEDPEYRLAKIAEKQARIEKNLSSKMPEIQQQLKSMATEGNENAKVLYLITQTGFRVGGEGDGAARVKAYGASTLMGEHVKVEGNKTTFDFIGKEGVRQFHEVNDPIIASMCKNAKPGEKLFNTNDAKIRKEWKKLGGEKVHDIRSYVATQDARKEISKLIPPVPKDEKEMSKIKMQVATVVAKKLGNKPIESLRTYINPNVFMVK